MSNVVILILVGAAMFAVLGGVTLLTHIYNLNNIKSKTVGDGQHGTARWATRKEIRQTYKHIPFTPKRWREQAKNGLQPTVAGAVRHKKRKTTRMKNKLCHRELSLDVKETPLHW